MEIGKNIRYRRAELDLTLEFVSSKVGISRQTLSRYETGIISNIPSDKIEALAEVLQTTPACLMGWNDEKPATQVGSGLSEDTMIFAEKVSRLSPEARQRLREYMELLELKDNQ